VRPPPAAGAGPEPAPARRRGSPPPKALRARAAVDRLVSEMPGPAALPRRNGELVFEAPWQSRAFGMAVALHGARAFDWVDFQRRLVEEIAAWERDHDDLGSWSYYERWVRSFERLLLEEGLVTGDELAAAAVAAAGAGEDDHRHDDHGTG
jgi:nitrile hydratase accessory protein